MTLNTKPQPLEGTSNASMTNAFMQALQREQQRVIDEGVNMAKVVELRGARFVEVFEQLLETPKPKPFKTVVPKQPILVEENVSTPPKPVYVLKPHLTTRPLRDNEALKALRESLIKTTPTRPRRKQ